jgi:hypothetical protein
MPKVVVKGESVYKCTTCFRSIRVPTNREGLDVLQRCMITHGCLGKLHRVTTTKDINETPAFPPEVENVQDWFQRKILYDHQQPVQSQTWTVKHQLSSRPNVHVFVNRLINGIETLVKIDPIKQITIDLNTLQLVFSMAESGIAQCIAQASQNTTNAGTQSGPRLTVPPTQITSNVGEITLATISTIPLIGIALTFRTSGTSSDVTIEYAGIDNTPSVASAWVGATKAIIDGKTYNIRSFNITTTPLAPPYFAAGAIPKGSTFFISSINGHAPEKGECLLLLSSNPHAVVDRIYTQYIDTFSIDHMLPELYYSSGVAYSSTGIIKSTYPSILVV